MVAILGVRIRFGKTRTDKHPFEYAQNYLPVSARIIADNQIVATVFLDRVRRTNDLTDISGLADSRSSLICSQPCLRSCPS
ncbi:hypothetical protein HTG_09010 [Natrinema mahii]|nr:hypothetical protein HTG_09010 [Natrinema mahii]